jgi:glycosyltransferase involved in cell wall biosynthesis
VTGTGERKIRLLVIATHPIQYQVPLFRRLAQSEVLDLQVAFLTDYGISPSFDPGFQKELAFDVPLTEGYVHTFLSAGCTTHPSRFAIPSLGKLKSLLNRNVCDVVLPPGYGMLCTWLICAIAQLRRIPYLTRAETRVESDRSRPGPRRLIKHLILGPMLRRSRACLAIGSSNEEFYRSYGVSEERLVLAPYSVDNDLFAMAGAKGRTQRREMLSSLGLDPVAPTICFAGKLQPYKRPLDLITSYRRLGVEANLIVIGEGPLRDPVQKGISGLPRARHLGFVNQSGIGQWFGACDVLVLPSDFEPWGLVVNEAMAAGAVPIVSSEVGCAPDLVRPDGGEIFPVGDCDALAAALNRFLGNKATLRTARGICAEAIARHSIEETVRGYERAVLAASSGSAALA